MARRVHLVHSMANIDEIMSRDPTTCQEHDSLDIAAQRMWDRDVGALPVVDPLGYPIGVITDRDIAMAAYTRGCPLSQITVKTAMSGEIHTVHETATVDQVQASMQRHRVRRLPVVDRQGQVVGIVTLVDLARCAGPSSRADVTASDVVHTLRTISEPRGQRRRVIAAQ